MRQMAAQPVARGKSMFRKILSFGLISGVVVGVAIFGLTLGMNGHSLPDVYAMLITYLIMLVALSAVFIAIKRRRDDELGGVISFWQALLMGLGISFIASVFYVVAWEAALAVGHIDFAASYANGEIAAQRAKGVNGAALAKFIAEMNAFKAAYASPLSLVPEAFSEIFPVGVLVTLISAGLLRNRRFLPARRS
jgi:hypothetical protein